MRSSPLILMALLAVSSAQAQTQKPAAPSAADAMVQRCETIYRIDDDGRGSMTQTVRVTILTAAGRNTFGQVHMSVTDPIEQGGFEYVRTIKPNGRVVTADPSATVEVRPRRGGAEDREFGVTVKAVTVPELQPGDEVEFRIAKTFVPLMKNEFWVVHSRTSLPGVQRELVTLDVPRSRLLVVRTDSASPQPEVEDRGLRRLYRWSDPGQAVSDDAGRRPLFAASTVPSWKDLVDWFIALQPPTPADQAIREKAQELTAGLSGDRARADALFGWVSRSVRWIGAPFANHGYRARPPAEVMRTGWGDCKDKHTLLASMLGSLGIPSSAALVSVARASIHPDVPALSQFDHVVTVARIGSEDVWLDATLEVTRPGQLLPSIRGSQALLVEPGAGRLVRVPGEAVASSLRVSGKGSITPAGSLELDTTIEVGGDLDLPLRLVLRQGGNEARAELARLLAASQAPSGEARDVSGSEPVEVDVPLSLRYRLVAAGFVSGSGAQRAVRLPSSLVGLIGLQSVADIGGDDRSDATPVSGIGTVDANETLELAFPAETKVVAPIPVKVATAAGGFEANYEVNGNLLLVRRSMHLPGFRSLAQRGEETLNLRTLAERDANQEVAVSDWPASAGPPESDAKTTEELTRAGQASLDAGKAPEAVQLLELALEKTPADGRASLALADALGRLGRWGEAEAALGRRLDVNPLDRDAARSQVTLRLNRQRYPAAIAGYSKYLGANPFDALGWLELAGVYHALGRSQEAVAALEAGARADRSNPLALLALTHLLREQGRTAEARQRFEEARKREETLGLVAEFPKFDWPFLDWLSPPTPLPPGIRPNVPPGVAAAEAKTELEAAVARLDLIERPDMDLATVGEVLQLTEALVRLARADVAAGELERARSKLATAHEISLDGAVAAELCEVDSRLGRFKDALRAWALVDHSSGAPMPGPLAEHLKKTGPSGNELAGRLKTLGYSALDSRSLAEGAVSPSERTCKPEAKEAKVVLRAVVDQDGRVAAAEVLSGSELCRSEALHRGKALQLPRLVVEGRAVRTARTIVFLFHQNQSIEGHWGYGLNPVDELAGVASRISHQ